MPQPLRVLLVEDCEAHARMVELLLGRTTAPTFEFTHVENLAEAIALIHEQPFDVALMDLGLPDSEGLCGVKRVKAAAPELALVVLTACTDEELAMEVIAEGAQEFLSKELMVGHLLVRVIRHSIARQKQLLDAQAQALRDALTGIANRRAFNLELERRAAESERSGNSFFVAMFDVDHFKRVNDTYGHEAGDEVLRQVAGVLESQVRDSDFAARIGGEEFAVIMPTDESEVAIGVAQRIRLAVGNLAHEVRGTKLPVTISGGVAMYDGDTDLQSVVRRADDALYNAKHQGRNQIVCQRVSLELATV